MNMNGKDQAFPEIERQKRTLKLHVTREVSEPSDYKLLLPVS
jgi:hypothetical protein